MNGNYLTELRRSNAAGIHDHQPSRSESRRLAILESEEDMPNEDYDPTDFEVLEPTEDDLREIDEGDDEDLYYDYDEYDDFEFDPEDDEY